LKGLKISQVFLLSHDVDVDVDVDVEFSKEVLIIWRAKGWFMKDEYKWWWWWRRHYGFQLSSVEMERGLESLIENSAFIALPF
jgi:hypothetical protein